VQGAYHPTGVVRTYYLGADEVLWDYTRADKNLITGNAFEDESRVFVQAGPGRIGSAYLKCVYHRYTDATFRTPAPIRDDAAYVGLMGPVIRAEVGDTIKVVFRNRGCRIPTSVHPHGVFHLKASEGAPYADNTSGRDELDNGVAEGHERTYTWLVPLGPAPGRTTAAP